MLIYIYRGGHIRDNKIAVIYLQLSFPGKARSLRNGKLVKQVFVQLLHCSCIVQNLQLLIDDRRASWKCQAWTGTTPTSRLWSPGPLELWFGLWGTKLNRYLRAYVRLYLCWLNKLKSWIQLNLWLYSDW